MVHCFLSNCYLGRHSPESGCAGIHGNNRDPNCCCSSSTVLRPDDPDRHSVLAPPSGAVDSRSTEAGEILLQRGHLRFELVTTLLVPVGWRLRVDDLANDNVGRTSCIMTKPTKSPLKKAPEVEPEVRCTKYDRDNGHPGYDVVSHCRRSPGGAAPLRAVIWSRNFEARSS